MTYPVLAFQTKQGGERGVCLHYDGTPACRDAIRLLAYVEGAVGSVSGGLTVGDVEGRLLLYGEEVYLDYWVCRYEDDTLEIIEDSVFHATKEVV